MSIMTPNFDMVSLNTPSNHPLAKGEITIW